MQVYFPGAATAPGEGSQDDSLVEPLEEDR